jgi:hypothetical protein
MRVGEGGCVRVVSSLDSGVRGAVKCGGWERDDEWMLTSCRSAGKMRVMEGGGS